MKELDFDELDRAVSSLMGKVSSAPAVQPNQSDVVLKPEDSVDASDDISTTDSIRDYEVDQELSTETITSPETITPPVTYSTSTSAPIQERSPGPRTTSLNPERRGGRFMDVVHPSSDMSTSSMGTSATNASRMGVRLSPINDNIVPEEAPEAEPSSTIPQPSSVEADVNPDDSEFDSAKTLEDYHWPDPINMPNSDDKENVIIQEQISVEGDVSEKPDAVEHHFEVDAIKETPIEAPVSDLDTEHSHTPFISNPKVDKRPLNAQASADSDESVVDTSEQIAVPVAASESIATPPPELNKELIAIESSDATSIIEETAVQQPLKNAPIATSSSIASSSIYQQYKEKPSTGDQTHAAIYDTADVATSIAHPERKKSGWLIVAGVVMLLALGVGGAALLYFSGIIG